MIVIILIIAIVSGIYLITLVKKCSPAEATQIVKRFLLEIGKEFLREVPARNPNPAYPVWVGYDGNRIIPAIVDKEFQKVSDNFLVCYCFRIAIAPDGNTIRYYFSILRKPDSADDDLLQTLLQKEVEEILTRTLLMYDCFLPAEVLTAVELQGTRLNVTFAQTPSGIQQLDALKQCTRRRQVLRKRKKICDNFSEDWKNEQ